MQGNFCHFTQWIANAATRHFFEYFQSIKMRKLLNCIKSSAYA